MFELYCDGACYPNPGGLASFGFLLYRDGRLLERGSGIIGHQHNMNNLNAEYAALSYGLLAIIRHIDAASSEAIVYCDSKFVVDQLTGVCKKIKYAKGRGLLDLHAKLIRSFGVNLNFQWIPRDKNKLADNLARSLRTVDRTEQGNFS